ncbi:hypothetical protein CALVIDRAFT_283978 [Calocera viscosa TUFC12733]|uniref:Arrestin-like N-terminal domain-containing protein n=1 Tax=Calocera viscosa (strain TUFC12733) TaxID=1330018 RepID=A0A167ITH0_CALVF|nr:hypothetical protein CALVIDRAFT_283978 [Calocera viscosa TUFC12733]
MAIPAQTVECQQPLRSTYVCSGVTVQGLPTRSVLKSESRYFVTISIDKVQVWKSREIRSKESTVVWNEGEDKHEFECAPAASLKATVCKNHSRGRPAEEVARHTANYPCQPDPYPAVRLAEGYNSARSRDHPSRASPDDRCRC